MLVKKNEPLNILFTKENYKWMIIGGIIIALGDDTDDGR